MLEAIRKRAAGIVVKAFLGILILSFAIWGMGDVVRSLSTSALTTVARVGEVDIPPETLNRELQREVNRMRRLFGDRFDLAQARAMGIDNAVLGNIIRDTLFRLGAEDLDVAISDALVGKTIRSNDAFKGVLGKFDRFQYQQVLQNNGFTEKMFEARVRDDLARGQFLGSIEAGGKAPKALIEDLYRYRQEKRVAENLLIADDVMDAGEPDEGALAQHHQDNPGDFTAPEYRKLTFIGMTAEELAGEIAVSEDELKEAFDQREGEFKQPERRLLKQMVLASEELARKAHDRLAMGGVFADVAKEVANIEAEALDLGAVVREDLLAELAEAAFSLSQGAFSQPLKSPFGWHLLLVEGIDKARSRSLDEVRQLLKAGIAREKAIDSLFELANRLEDELGGGASLEEAAGRLNLRITNVSAVDAKGLGIAGAAVAGLPAGGQFLATAFATPEKNESALTEAGTDGYFIVRIDGVTPSATRPLDTVRAQVAEAWKAARRAEAAEKEARAILARLRGGDTQMAAVAASLNVKVATSEPFIRSPQDNAHGLPAALVASLFEIAPGEYATARGENGYIVARLNEVLDADPGADKSGLAALEAQISNSMRADLLSQLSVALRGRYPVTINSRAVDQLF